MKKSPSDHTLTGYPIPTDPIPVAAHVFTQLRTHYLRRHEDTRIRRILSAGDFVSTRYALGLHYVCRPGPALFSCQCGLQTKPTALRTRRQHPARAPFFNQLPAHRAVRFVLPNDQRTISDVAVAGVRVGSPGLYGNGAPRGTGAGHQRESSLPHA